ncbi:MAG: alginate export family protein [Rubrivivax sp.]|nr:alginate export family protein [Rubrivivax sp.]
MATMRKPDRPLFLLLGLLLSLPCFLAAAENPASSQQSPAVRVYLPNRADEDWSFLRDGDGGDFWDSLKYIPLGGENRYLTLSGEIRFRPEGFRIRSTEGAPSNSDSYLLQRYLFGADWRLGPRFRVFTEIQSGILTGIVQSPRPTDENSLDLHQAFFEWRQPSNSKRAFGIKVGRQEVEVGSSRLISASPGMNVKRSFDGVVVDYRRDAWRFSAVGAKLVSIEKGMFDDQPDHEQTFYGVAASREGFLVKQGRVAIYYLGLDRAKSFYSQGIGRDRRHTAGWKWAGSRNRVDLNYDAILQWGSFENAPVRAWAFSSETGYRFANTRWKPRISVRADMASGDHDPKNPDLQSFNPLFPGNSYAGVVGMLGPTNLTDLTPAVSLMVRKSLMLTFELPSYWRTSPGDGLYSPDQRVLVPSGAGQGKYVGTNPGIIAVWQITSHLQFQGAVTRLFPGRFLEKTFVANGNSFYSATALYRF